MQIDDVPFGTGHAIVKAVQLGDICLRHIEFTAGCSADDWCYKGHIGFVLSGAFSIAIKNGGRMEISAGDSFHLSDHQDLHRAESERGATVFVIDQAAGLSATLEAYGPSCNRCAHGSNSGTKIVDAGGWHYCSFGDIR